MTPSRTDLRYALRWLVLGVLLGAACAGLDRLMAVLGAPIAWDDGSSAAVDAHRAFHGVVDSSPVLILALVAVPAMLVWGAAVSRHTAAGGLFAAALLAVTAATVGNISQLLLDPRGVANWIHTSPPSGVSSTGDFAALGGVPLLILAAIEIAVQVAGRDRLTSENGPRACMGRES